MPNTILKLRSEQRRLEIPNRPEYYRVQGRTSGRILVGEVDWAPGRLRWNAVPDTYELSIDIPEFKHSRARFAVGQKPSTKSILIPSRCTKLPTYSQLAPWQPQLLGTLAPSKTAGQVWASLSDNQRATFFQITYALGKYQLGNGATLADYVRRILRVGGSDMIGPNPKKPGKKIRVVGWRIHVAFLATYRSDLEQDLLQNGFKKDDGKAHPTHSRFGYVKSFRQRKGSPKLQITLNRDNSGADIDLDAGAFHLSAPHNVYKKLAKTFPAVKKHYKVD
jgi:hypothetical protein